MKKFFVITILFALNFCLAKPPSVMFVYPAGAKAGETVKVIIGALDADSAKAITLSSPNSRAKILKISPMPEDRVKAADNRNEAKGMKFIEAEISIAKNAPSGFCDLRLSSPEGASTRYFFEVYSLPELMEKENPESPKSAQAIKKMPCIINGQIYEGDIDTFKFDLKKDKTYVFNLKARAIRPYLADAVPGWFQATLRLKDAKGESVAYADDFQNSPDPVLIYTPQKDGEYFLEVQDALFRGRDDFVYRLHAGELPFIEYIYPCGANVEKESVVEVYGVNLPCDKIKIEKGKMNEKMRDISVNVEYAKNCFVKSNDVKFVFDQFDEKPLPASAEIPSEFASIPVIYNGIFATSYEKRYVKFKAKKGESLVFEVMSARLGYPCDTKLTIYKLPQMQKIVESDDIDDKSFGLVTAQLDPRIIHTFKEDGEYLLKLEEAQNKGSQDAVFRLKISAPELGLELFASPANPQISIGNFAPIKITAIKSGGWDGEIELFAKDLPNGFSSKKSVIAPKKDTGILMISASPQAKQKAFLPKFFARANIGGNSVEIPVKASEELTQAFFINHTLPIDNVELAVLPQAPFTLEWVDLPELPIHLNAGNTFELTVKVKRLRTIKGKIRIGAYRGSRGLQITQKPPQKAASASTGTNASASTNTAKEIGNEDEVIIELKGNANAMGVISDDALPAGFLNERGVNYIYCLPPLPYVLHGKVVNKFNRN